jgi:hypothetical protein
VQAGPWGQPAPVRRDEALRHWPGHKAGEDRQAESGELSGRGVTHGGLYVINANSQEVRVDEPGSGRAWILEQWESNTRR